MTQITYTKTTLQFFNVRKAGDSKIIATLNPSQMSELLGYTPAGRFGCAEVAGL